MPLPEDILTKVRDDFGEDDGLLVLQELKHLQAKDSEIFDHRVVRCIIALSNGSIEKFDRWIEESYRDWRDVIVAAEGWACSALLMTFPFPEHLEESVCRHWLIGKKIRIPWAKENDEPWTIEANDIREIFLRQLKQDDSADPSGSNMAHFRGAVKVLCARGQWVSSSPAFEAWFAIWYSIDHTTKIFALKRIAYNPNEIKKRGEWK